MEPETFDVMLLATIPGGGIRHGQWYTDSAHDGLEAAQWRFREITQELADPRLVVVVVASRFDDAAGLYRERIVAARAEGPVPALRRAFRRAPPAGLAPRGRARPKPAPGARAGGAGRGGRRGGGAAAVLNAAAAATG